MILSLIAVFVRQLTLTKQPERMVDLVAGKIGEILPNVWRGTSIEDADVVDVDAPARNC